MIKANELRIGNWTNDTRTISDRTLMQNVFHPTQIQKIEKDYINKFFEPIPLTPEILEKCGFTEFYRSEWQIKFEYPTNRYDMIVVFKNSRIMLFYGDTYLKDIESLHDLQNTYYSFTGEELEVRW